VDKTSLLASSQLLFQLKFIELIQPNQHLPWGWKEYTTIVLFHPDLGEFRHRFGEEWRGFDSLECSGVFEWLARAYPAPFPAIDQTLYQFELHV